MKKIKKDKFILNAFLYAFALPVIAGVIFTCISSALSDNYYYIPEWADSLIIVFYKLGGYCIEFGTYLGMGFTSYAMMFSPKKLFFSIPLTIIQAVCGSIALYLTRLAFFFSDTSDETMSEYFYLDIVNASTYSLKFAVTVLMLCAALIIYGIIKKTPVFENPYIVPTDGIQIVFAAFFGIMIIGTMTSFLVYGNFESADVLDAALVEGVNIAGYFVAILGAYIAKKSFKTLK